MNVRVQFPSDTGGVAAPSRRRCEATAAAQTGWSGLPKCFGSVSSCVTTPSASSKEASRLFLDVASTPPTSGGEWRAPIYLKDGGYYDDVYEKTAQGNWRFKSRSYVSE